MRSWKISRRHFSTDTVVNAQDDNTPALGRISALILLDKWGKSANAQRCMRLSIFSEHDVSRDTVLVVCAPLVLQKNPLGKFILGRVLSINSTLYGGLAFHRAYVRTQKNNRGVSTAWIYNEQGYVLPHVVRMRVFESLQLC